MTYTTVLNKIVYTGGIIFEDGRLLFADEFGNKILDVSAKVARIVAGAIIFVDNTGKQYVFLK